MKKSFPSICVNMMEIFHLLTPIDRTAARSDLSVAGRAKLHWPDSLRAKRSVYQANGADCGVFRL